MHHTRAVGEGVAYILGVNTIVIEILLLVTVASALAPLLFPGFFGNGKETDKD